MLGKHWAYLYEIVEVMKVRRAFCELDIDLSKVLYGHLHEGC